MKLRMIMIIMRMVIWLSRLGEGSYEDDNDDSHGEIDSYVSGLVQSKR